MYQTEINKIKAVFDPEVYQLLQESDVVLAGGAITSVSTNREVNDYDIYFKSKDVDDFYSAPRPRKHRYVHIVGVSLLRG